MNMHWLENFIDKLSKLLKEPPYLLFVFISAVMVFISLIFKQAFEQVWAFFLYSVGGTIWRYIERDFIGQTFMEGFLDKSKPVFRRWIISIYHIGNVGLLLALLHYLKLL